MDANKVRIFLRAVENGSLLKTASQLGYTQAGLTHMMNTLENETGVKLLQRGKFGIRLTEEGRRLLPYFKELVSAEEKILKEAELIQKQKASVIRLAAVSSVIRTWLPDAMRIFQEENEGIYFEIKECDERIYETFDEGRADMCITSNILPRKDFIPLMKDDFFAVLPENYVLDEGAAFPLKKIEEESFLFPFSARDWDVEQTLKKYGISLNRRTILVDDNSAAAMVAKGFGVSLLPALVLEDCRERVKIAETDLPCSRRIGMIYDDSKKGRAAVKKFAAFLKNRQERQK